MKVALTGGHLTPTLAVIEELRGVVEIIFIGRKYATEGDRTKSAESSVITGLKIPFFPIDAGRLQRQFTRYTIPALLKIPVGFFQAFGILIKNDPDVVISFGGYVALPVVIAARLQRIPVLTHEQTTEIGLANRIIAYLATRVAVSWESSMVKFPKKKVILTGNPIRNEILAIKREKPAKEVLYITGGNQGAHVINEAVEEILSSLAAQFEVYHQTGGSEIYHDFERISEKLKTLKEEDQKNYQVAKWYSTAEVSDILAKASLVIGRSGANTVCELAYLGIPAIFIPLPSAGNDEQRKNAQILASLGAAVIILQNELTGKRLLTTIEIVMKELTTFQKNATGAKKLVKTDAAQKIAQEALKIAKRKP